jgi:hypothetical protein
VSLCRNFENLETHLLDELDCHFNIIGVTETKITNSNQSTYHPHISGYIFEHAPTPVASASAGMFIDETLNYHVLEQVSNEAFQAVWIQISFEKEKNIICGIIYSQHNSPDPFKQYYEESLEKFVSSGKTIFIMGDFNIDLLKCEICHYSQEFLLLLQSCYLVATIDKPTCVRNGSASLIDNIFVNVPDQIKVSGNIISDISDHFSQFCIIKSGKYNKKLKQHKSRDFSKFSMDNFIGDLSLVDWDQCLIYANVDNCVNKHAPMKLISKRKVKQLSKPWITKGIRASIKIKNRLLASGNEIKYKLYRNSICSLTRLSKKKYYYDYFNAHITNMKKSWAGINDLLNYKTKNRKEISMIKDHKNNNVIVWDHSGISNILNDHFAQIGSQLANKLPPSQINYKTFLDKLQSPNTFSVGR